MDAKSIADQARERARIALEQEQLRQQEAKEQENQEAAQRQRSDYPDILRAKISAGLNVEKTGDYTQDLAAFQGQMREFINTIPAALLLKAECSILARIIGYAVEMLSIVPDIPAHILGSKPSEDRLKPYIDQVLHRNLRARTFANLLSDAEVRERLYATCEPETFEARLNALAGEVQQAKPTVGDSDAFQADCRSRWIKVFEAVEAVNAIGYFQTNGTYILRANINWKAGWRYDSGMGYVADTTDRTFILSRINQGAEVARIAKIVETLKGWTVALETLPPQTKKALDELECEAYRATALGKLIRSLEVFGVWSTNQCIDTTSHPYHVGELAEPFLEMLNEYAAVSPVSAVVILHRMASTVGSCYGYNCPEESLVDNGREPAAWIDVFKLPEVRSVFQGKRSPKWVALQVHRLFAVCRQYINWRKDSWQDWHFRQGAEPKDIAEQWLKVRNDEAYWQALAEEERRRRESA